VRRRAFRGDRSVQSAGCRAAADAEAGDRAWVGTGDRQQVEDPVEGHRDGARRVSDGALVPPRSGSRTGADLVAAQAGGEDDACSRWRRIERIGGRARAAADPEAATLRGGYGRDRQHVEGPVEGHRTVRALVS